MRSDVQKMLKRAAECQKLAAPEDRLTVILRTCAPEAELDESSLDQVAAAVQFRQGPQSIPLKKREQ
mgnify:CR=1 FL=1